MNEPDDDARVGPRVASRVDRLAALVRSEGLEHEILIIAISYGFVFAGAWHEGLIGLAPTEWSLGAESLMALVLSAEIVTRLRFVTHRTPGFWFLLACDAFSVLTVIPLFAAFTFARLIRMAYASLRVIGIVDRLAVRDGNALYFLILYPLVVPLAAAMLYAFEQHAPKSPVHNYVQALVACFTFALSLGTVKPASTGGTVVCGALFIFGIMCIGILTNFISNRYAARKA